MSNHQGTPVILFFSFSLAAIRNISFKCATPPFSQKEAKRKEKEKTKQTTKFSRISNEKTFGGGLLFVCVCVCVAYFAAVVSCFSLFFFKFAKPGREPI